MTTMADQVRRRIAADYAALDISKQAKVLATLGDRFTLLARDTYNHPDDVADTKRLRKFNEAGNRIFGHLTRILTNDDRRYPDDVYADILVDQLDALDISTDELRRIIDSA
jgi:hypothetical protein